MNTAASKDTGRSGHYPGSPRVLIQSCVFTALTDSTHEQGHDPPDSDHVVLKGRRRACCALCNFQEAVWHTRPALR